MKQQINLSMPSAIECIIMTLISMVDTFAISCLGSTVIAAVGAMVSIINFLNLILKSIQVSNNVTIARAIGKNDKEKLKINTGTAVFLVIIFQCTCILLTIIFSPFIPKIFKVDKKREALKELLKLAKHGIADRIFDRGGKLVLDIILSRLGTYEYAAHIILNQIESFANDFCYGFGIGITTNIGIKIGKNDKKGIKELKYIINRITIIFAIIIPIIIFIVLIVLLPILLKEKETLTIAYRLVPLVIIYSVLMPIRYKYSSIIEGMKEFKYNAQISGITNVIKILLAYIFCKYIGISGAWLTFSISYIIIIIALKIKIKKSKLVFC